MVSKDKVPRLTVEFEPKMANYDDPAVFDEYLARAREKYMFVHETDWPHEIKAICPGRYLGFIIDNGRTKEGLAEQLGLGVPDLDAFIEGHLPVNYRLALEIHKITGISPEMLCNTQAAHEAWTAVEQARERDPRTTFLSLPAPPAFKLN